MLDLLGHQSHIAKQFSECGNRNGFLGAFRIVFVAACIEFVALPLGEAEARADLLDGSNFYAVRPNVDPNS